MNKQIDSTLRKKYVAELQEADPELACKFVTLAKTTQRRWIILMDVYGIRARDGIHALREYLSLVPTEEMANEECETERSAMAVGTEDE